MIPVSGSLMTPTMEHGVESRLLVVVDQDLRHRDRPALVDGLQGPYHDAEIARVDDGSGEAVAITKPMNRMTCIRFDWRCPTRMAPEIA